MWDLVRIYKKLGSGKILLASFTIAAQVVLDKVKVFMFYTFYSYWARLESRSTYCKHGHIHTWYVYIKLQVHVWSITPMPFELSKDVKSESGGETLIFTLVSTLDVLVLRAMMGICCAACEALIVFYKSSNWALYIISRLSLELDLNTEILKLTHGSHFQVLFEFKTVVIIA